MSFAPISHRSGSTWAVLALLCVLAVGSRGQERVINEDFETIYAQALAPTARAWDFDEILWLAGTRDHGKIEPVLERIRAELAVENPAHELQLKFLLGLLLERNGQLDEAMKVFKAITTAAGNLDLALEIAQLHDMLGQTAEAKAAYLKLLDAELEPALRKTLELRVALLDPDKNYESLQAYASSESLSATERNEAAVILGLGGREKEAVQHFSVSGEKSDRFRQLVRLAEWALGADDFATAQGLAWQAVETAVTKRDRRYALSLVASAYRAANQIQALLDRLAAEAELSQEARALWVDLLREEGRANEALDLVRSGSESDWGPQLKRQLLEICRETGDPALLISAFRELIVAEPLSLEWRSGLSRHFLEQGQSPEARAVWTDLPADGIGGDELLNAAHELADVGLSDVARDFARRVAQSESHRDSALLFLARLEHQQGGHAAMIQVLQEIEAKAEPKAGIRAEVAGEYERIGRLDLAIKTLEELRQAHDGFLGTDLEMKYALTLSKVAREEDALVVWRELWVRLRGTPRGRYVEDRLMTVASRIGVLAKIAIELEDRLAQGSADMKDIDLLVRLYIKVSDPASATEIIEEYLKKVGSADLDILKRKAQIYAACQDYYHYEKVCHQLIAADEENRLDHMRELVMSQLDRGRRDEAIAMLPKIRAAGGEAEAIADEFEAGVYGLAGLKDLALESYMRGLGRNPDRIDTLLLVANLLQENGQEMQAARRFQNLAMRADKDDLFTIAMDGLLNLRAPRQSRVPDAIMSWALRLTLERLAHHPDKFYLYRLATDIAVELKDMNFAIRTLKAAVPIAGERRTPLLREIMSKSRTLDKAQRQSFGFGQEMKVSADWDASDYLMMGRRLLGQGEYVPPQVFMDMAAVFLAKGKVADAMRTFSRASELLERGEVTLQAAQVLEKAGSYDESLTFYRRLLATDADNVELLFKVAEIEELSAEDQKAHAVYARGLDLALEQVLRRIVRDQTTEEKDENDIFGGRQQRNVDALSATTPKLVAGLLATFEDEAAARRLAEGLAESCRQELAELQAEAEPISKKLAEHPRLATMLSSLRRLALSYRFLALMDRVDAEVRAAFPDDETALEAMVSSRTARGLTASAARLLKMTGQEQNADLAAMAGISKLEGRRLSAASVAREVIAGLDQPTELARLFERVDTAQATEVDLKALPQLLAASLVLGQPESAENFARSAIRLVAGRGYEGLDQGMSILGVASSISPRLAQELLETLIEKVLEKQPQLASSLSWRVDEVPGVTLSSAMVESVAKRMVESRTKGRPVYGLSNWLGKLEATARPALARELYDLLDPDQRAHFLVEAASHLEDPLDEVFLSWFERALSAALSGGQTQTTSNLRAPQGSASPDLKLRVMAVLEEKGGVEGLRIQRWSTLVDAERTQEAMAEIAAAPEALIKAAQDQGISRFYCQQLIDKLGQAGQAEALLPLIDAALKTTPEAPELQQLRFKILGIIGGDTYLQALKVALAAKPDDLTQLARLRSVQSASGDHDGMIATLKRMIELKPEVESYQKQLRGLYSARRMPIEAEAIRLQLQARELDERPESGPSSGAMITVSGQVVMATVIGASSSGSDTDPVATIRGLIKSGQKAAAQAALRKVWRGLADTSRYPRPLESRLVWRRTGPSQAPKPGEKPIRTVLGAAAKDASFVASEAALVLRFIEDEGLEADDLILTELIDLALPEPETERRALLHELRAALSAGTGGAMEVSRLFRLLEDDWVEDELRVAIIDELVARRALPQVRQLRGLARGLALGNRQDAAMRLYHLAALLSNASARDSYMNDAAAWRDLLQEVEEALGPDQGPTAVLTLLAALRPTDYRLGSWVHLAAETWERLLGPADALPRLMAVLEEPGADIAWELEQIRPAAARLALQAGDLPAALQVLKFTLTEDDRKAVTRRGRVIEVQRTAARASSFLRRIWQRYDPAEQKTIKVDCDLLLLYQGLKSWHEAALLEFPEAVFPVLALRMIEAEVMTDELAEELTEILKPLSSDSHLLDRSRAELARRLGADDLVFSLEAKMLAAGKLEVDHYAGHLRSLALQSTPAAALAAGEQLVQSCNHPDLLQVLVDLATELGDAATASRYSELQQQVVAQEAADKARAEALIAEPEEEVEDQP